MSIYICVYIYIYIYTCEPKEVKRESTWSQMAPEGNQQVAQMNKSCSKIHRPLLVRVRTSELKVGGFLPLPPSALGAPTLGGCFLKDAKSHKIPGRCRVNRKVPAAPVIPKVNFCSHLSPFEDLDKSVARGCLKRAKSADPWSCVRYLFQARIASPNNLKGTHFQLTFNLFYGEKHDFSNVSQSELDANCKNELAQYMFQKTIKSFILLLLTFLGPGILGLYYRRKHTYCK